MCFSKINVEKYSFSLNYNHFGLLIQPNKYAFVFIELFKKTTAELQSISLTSNIDKSSLV